MSCRSCCYFCWHKVFASHKWTFFCARTLSRVLFEVCIPTLGTLFQIIVTIPNIWKRVFALRGLWNRICSCFQNIKNRERERERESHKWFKGLDFWGQKWENFWENFCHVKGGGKDEANANKPSTFFCLSSWMSCRRGDRQKTCGYCT